MKLYIKLLRLELSLISKVADVCPLDMSRAAMDKMGSALTLRHRKSVSCKNIADINAKYIVPASLNRDALILYLHGGGYVLGGMEYAEGFGTLEYCCCL